MTHPVLRTPSPLPAWVPLVFGGVAAWAGIQDSIASAFIALLAVGCGVVCSAIAWPRKVEIGVEGLRVRPRFGIGGSMIPYTTIRLAAPDGPKRLVIRTMRNEVLTLYAGYLTAIPAEVLDRLWKAIAAGAEDGSRGVERQALARSGRSTAEWRNGLRELAKPATYRNATVSRDRLWTIAENPGLDVEIRGGAIVALSAAALDEAGKKRLREIDAATLHPALHVLLDHGAAGAPDDRIVDAALDGLSR